MNPELLQSYQRMPQPSAVPLGECRRRNIGCCSGSTQQDKTNCCFTSSTAADRCECLATVLQQGIRECMLSTGCIGLQSTRSVPPCPFQCHPRCNTLNEFAIKTERWIPRQGIVHMPNSTLQVAMSQAATN